MANADEEDAIFADDDQIAAADFERARKTITEELDSWLAKLPGWNVRKRDSNEVVLETARLLEAWKGRKVQLAAAIALRRIKSDIAFSPTDLKREVIWELLEKDRNIKKRERATPDIIKALNYLQVPLDGLEVALKAAGGVHEIARHSSKDDDLVKRANKMGRRAARASPEDRKEMFRKVKPKSEHRAKR